MGRTFTALTLLYTAFASQLTRTVRGEPSGNSGNRFSIHTKLHRSKTHSEPQGTAVFLVSIRNYIALKRIFRSISAPSRLVSIRNYIALKRTMSASITISRLVSIRNYIALKRSVSLFFFFVGLVSIRNYIALKLHLRVLSSKSCLVSIRNYIALKLTVSGIFYCAV